MFDRDQCKTALPGPDQLIVGKVRVFLAFQDGPFVRKHDRGQISNTRLNRKQFLFYICITDLAFLEFAVLRIIQVLSGC